MAIRIDPRGDSGQRQPLLASEGILASPRCFDCRRDTRAPRGITSITRSPRLHPGDPLAAVGTETNVQPIPSVSPRPRILTTSSSTFPRSQHNPASQIPPISFIRGNNCNSHNRTTNRSLLSTLLMLASLVSPIPQGQPSKTSKQVGLGIHSSE